ncbi:helix-turn-helix domain-containing protein [Leucobacter albus]|uniref:Helix-turn-helix domain-containing protein n=1 Tax=Leucobacter albus TaxID=272210 RepID=A0ABW3TN26_9MICO
MPNVNTEQTAPAARELMRSLPAVLSLGGDAVSPASAIRDTLRIMAGELLRPQLGVTPIAYLARWRMSVAQSRLANEEVPIGVLAAELGYSSEAAFNRAFSRIVGCTPGSLRKKSR